MILNCSDSEETKISRAVLKRVFLILMRDLNSFYVTGKYLTKEWCLHHTMLRLPVKSQTLIRRYPPYVS